MEGTTQTAWITVGDSNPAILMRLDGGVSALIRNLGLTLVTFISTVGEWDNKVEEGYGYLVQFAPDQESLIRAALSHLAHQCGQDAIGFVGTCGGETLVRP